jgi:hypothetical protein
MTIVKPPGQVEQQSGKKIIEDAIVFWGVGKMLFLGLLKANPCLHLAAFHPAQPDEAETRADIRVLSEWGGSRYQIPNCLGDWDPRIAQTLAREIAAKAVAKDYSLGWGKRWRREYPVLLCFSVRMALPAFPVFYLPEPLITRLLARRSASCSSAFPFSAEVARIPRPRTRSDARD